MVTLNLHINLFIKLCPLLVGMYCSDCLQQKLPNENPLLAHISQRRGPPHPYLCDFKSSFDLFIKPGLNSSLPLEGMYLSLLCWPYCLHVLDSTMRFSKRKLTLLKRPVLNPACFLPFFCETRTICNLTLLLKFHMQERT